MSDTGNVMVDMRIRTSVWIIYDLKYGLFNQFNVNVCKLLAYSVDNL